MAAYLSTYPDPLAAFWMGSIGDTTWPHHTDYTYSGKDATTGNANISNPILPSDFGSGQLSTGSVNDFATLTMYNKPGLTGTSHTVTGPTTFNFVNDGSGWNDQTYSYTLTQNPQPLSTYLNCCTGVNNAAECGMYTPTSNTCKQVLTNACAVPANKYLTACGGNGTPPAATTPTTTPTTAPTTAPATASTSSTPTTTSSVVASATSAISSLTTIEMIGLIVLVLVVLASIIAMIVKMRQHRAAAPAVRLL